MKEPPLARAATDPSDGQVLEAEVEKSDTDAARRSVLRVPSAST